MEQSQIIGLMFPLQVGWKKIHVGQVKGRMSKVCLIPLLYGMENPHGMQQDRKN